MPCVIQLRVPRLGLVIEVRHSFKVVVSIVLVNSCLDLFQFLFHLREIGPRNLDQFSIRLQRLVKLSPIL